MTQSTILEIAVCTVSDRPAAEQARRAAMQAVRAFPGFVSWRALTAPDRQDLIADLVEWSDKPSADAAAARVQSDPIFAPYMAAIASVSLMQHFETAEVI